MLIIDLTLRSLDRSWLSSGQRNGKGETHAYVRKNQQCGHAHVLRETKFNWKLPPFMANPEIAP